MATAAKQARLGEDFFFTISRQKLGHVLLGERFCAYVKWQNVPLVSGARISWIGDRRGIYSDYFVIGATVFRLDYWVITVLIIDLHLTLLSE